MQFLLAQSVCNSYRHSNSGVGFPEFLAQAFGQRSHGVFGGRVEVQRAVWVHRVGQGATEKIRTVIPRLTSDPANEIFC